MADEVKVTLTLRKHVADRLRMMCHNRGLTASLLVDGWIFEHDDSGRPVPQVQPKMAADRLNGLVGDSPGQQFVHAIRDAIREGKK